jgi:hypothetical protein
VRRDLRFLATGWIEPMYGEPIWFFKYRALVRSAWSVTGMYVHYAVPRGSRSRSTARFPCCS